MSARIILLSVAVLCCPGMLRAQGFALPSSVADHGGGRGAGGGYVLDVSLGQPGIEDGSGGEFDVRGGFIPLLGAFAGPAASLSIALADGWNMVSVPLTVDDYAKTALFPTASSGAFAYDAAYTEYRLLENGRGYWIKFSGRQSAAMTGLAREKDTIQVAAGWNMVGSLSVAMPAASISTIPRGMTTSPFYSYQQEYLTSESIEPGKGYWVKASEPGELVLDASLSSLPGNRIRIVDRHEFPPPPPGVDSISQGGLPSAYWLSQNYPNPFNPSTRIDFALPTSGMVALRIYNILGQEVATLVNEARDAGYHSVSFSAGNLPSGVYTSRLTAGTFVHVRKMLLVK